MSSIRQSSRIDGTVETSSVDWPAVLAFLPMLERGDFSAGHWEGEGFSSSYSYRGEVVRFLDTLYSASVVYDFDWPAWRHQAERYLRRPSTLENARLSTLRKLLTLHVRKDRFSEGHFAAVLESGHIAGILKRAEKILASRPVLMAPPSRDATASA
jgi:O-acetyl-ADP-ribose deacetylase